MNRIFILVVTVLLCWHAFALGQEAKPFVMIGTGSVTGVYYAAGHAVAKVVNRNLEQHPFRVDALSSAGSVENINRVLNGEWDFGLAQADLLFKASHGLGPWQGRPDTRLRAVAVLYTEALTIIARTDAHIKTLEDLRGKKVSINEPGSSDNANMRALLSLLAINPEKDLTLVQVPPAESTLLLQKGMIDAYCYTVGHPNFSLVDAGYGDTEIQLVEIGDAIRQQIVSGSPYLVETSIPVLSYPHLKNTSDVPAIGVRAVLFTREDEPEGTVITVVHDLLGDLPRFRRQHPAFEKIQPRDLASETVVSFHPGAESAFRQGGIKP